LVHENWVRNGVAAVVLLGSAVTLSGCKLFVKEDPPSCPRVSILADASELTRFRAGPGRDITDIELQAKVADYHGACEYDKNSHTMHVALKVGLDLQRGAAYVAGPHSLQYFISVPTFFPYDGAKKVMTVNVDFPRNRDQLHLTDDEVELNFPVRNVRELERYEVFIGLQMDEAELQYTRTHRHY
jgi:hypothetical protein